MEESIKGQIAEILHLENLQQASARSYSPLVLAYAGDAFYELVIRTAVINLGNTSVNTLNRKTSNLAKAVTQAQIIHLIMDDLTEEELKVFKRGRNANSATVAKNASITDYRHATGFEAVIGWLYLGGQEQRALELIQLGLTRYTAIKQDGENGGNNNGV